MNFKPLSAVFFQRNFVQKYTICVWFETKRFSVELAFFFFVPLLGNFCRGLFLRVFSIWSMNHIFPPHETMRLSSCPFLFPILIWSQFCDVALKNLYQSYNNIFLFQATKQAFISWSDEPLYRRVWDSLFKYTAAAGVTWLVAHLLSTIWLSEVLPFFGLASFASQYTRIWLAEMPVSRAS